MDMSSLDNWRLTLGLAVDPISHTGLFLGCQGFSLEQLLAGLAALESSPQHAYMLKPRARSLNT